MGGNFDDFVDNSFKSQYLLSIILVYKMFAVAKTYIFISDITYREVAQIAIYSASYIVVQRLHSPGYLSKPS